MAGSTNYDIPENTWVEVATNTTIATVFNRDTNYKYYYTTVATGGAAPSAIVANTVPAGAIPLFKKGRDRELILADAGIDVYVTCFVNSHQTGGGKVRVDA